MAIVFGILGFLILVALLVLIFFLCKRILSTRKSKLESECKTDNNLEENKTVPILNRVNQDTDSAKATYRSSIKLDNINGGCSANCAANQSGLKTITQMPNLYVKDLQIKKDPNGVANTSSSMRENNGKSDIHYFRAEHRFEDDNYIYHKETKKFYETRTKILP